MDSNNYKYNIDQGIYSGVFAFPNEIVDQYLKLASQSALKVILCVLRSSGIDLDIDLIIRDTGLNISQIKDAFLFWEDMGVLKKGRSDYIIENRVYQTPLESDKSLESATPLPKKEIKPKEETKSLEKSDEKDIPNVMRISNSPKYPTQKEAAKRLTESEDIKFLVKKSEEILERPLNASALASLIMLLDWADIPSDIIIMVIHYCKSIDIRDMRRIEKTALNFKDMGIDTHKKADEYIKSKTKYNVFESGVKRILGVSERNLSKNESETFGVWYQKYGFTLELVEEAFTRCVDNIGKISLPYMNTILTNWHKEELRTKEDIELSEKKFLAKNSENKNKSSKNDSATYNITDAQKSDMYKVPKL